MDAVEYHIAWHIQDTMSPYGLILPIAVFEFNTIYSELRKTGILFRIACAEYLLECGITVDGLYIQRNSDRLEFRLDPVVDLAGKVHFFVTWEPDSLSISVFDESTHTPTKLGYSEGVLISTGQGRTVRLKTQPTLPPNSLLHWAREQAIFPKRVYDSPAEFRAAVWLALDAITEVIENLRLDNPFWDIEYDGPKLKGRSPKREPDIHPTIQALLTFIAQAKNFDIAREYLVAGGQLDFLISGPLSTGEIANACIEFKLAHSNDLVDGLLKQLPAYMKAKGCDFGIYCVLYFKGPDFPKPREYSDPNDLLVFLENEKRNAGYKNIRIRVLDVARQKTPSQL